MLYLIVCILTTYISSRLDLLYENVTGVSLLAEYHTLVIFHIVFCAFFFAYKTNKIYKKLPIPYLKMYQSIIILTCLIMSSGVFFPYTLNSHDLFSTLHVTCSMLGCVSFLVLLFIYTRYLSLYFPNIYLKIHWLYDLSLQFLIILLLVFTRVNGYIEIIFAIIVCSYLYMIEKEFQDV